MRATAITCGDYPTSILQNFAAASQFCQFQVSRSFGVIASHFTQHQKCYIHASAEENMTKPQTCQLPAFHIFINLHSGGRRREIVMPGGRKS
jgi:hypothetical protein